MQIKQAIKQILGTENYSVINFSTFNHTPNKSFDCTTSKAIQTKDDAYIITVHSKKDENGLTYLKKVIASTEGKTTHKIYRGYSNASAFDLINKLLQGGVNA